LLGFYFLNHFLLLRVFNQLFPSLDVYSPAASAGVILIV
jgi:hypothetical protein